MPTSPCSKSGSTRCASSSTSWNASGIATRISLLLLASCASSGVAWRGVAIAPEEKSSRESSISGVLERGRIFEKARIVLDRSFESVGFRGVPFAVEPGDQHAIVLESKQASLSISFDAELGDEPQVIDSFVPHFFLDLEVPAVSRPAR